MLESSILTWDVLALVGPYQAPTAHLHRRCMIENENLKQMATLI